MKTEKRRYPGILWGVMIALMLLSLFETTVRAEDVDVYRASVKNNAMLVIDVSGSMAWPVYNHEIDYRAFWDWATGVTPVNPDPVGKNDSTSIHKQITNWETNRIYLVSAYLGHAEITGSQGEKYSVMGDPMYSGLREGFIYYGIIDTGWTYTDLDDPVSGVTIETVTDSEGVEWVVYPSAVPDASGVTKDVNQWDTWVYYSDDARSGVTFFNHQAVRLTDVRIDPRTKVAKDYGFLGYMKAPGIYFSGLFRDEDHGGDYALTDDPDDAMESGDRERVYCFVTGNYLNFLKIVEDLDTTGEGDCPTDYQAWSRICYQPDGGGDVTWNTVNISSIRNQQYYTSSDYSSNRNESNGSIALGGFGGAQSVKVYFENLDVENRTIPGCDCGTRTGSFNDGVYLTDQAGNVLTMVTDPDTGIYETAGGRLYGCDASGWTGEYDVEGVTTINVKFFVASGGGDNCGGGDRGFKITKIKYSYLPAGSAGNEPATTGQAFTCCNGEDNVGYKIRSRLETAVEAMKIVLDDTEDKINWGLFTFSGNGKVLRNQLGSSVDAIKTSLDGLTAGGGTPMGEAMQDAYDAAYNYLYTHSETAECANNFMVVMTDGFPSGDDSWARIDQNPPNPSFSNSSQHDGDTWGGDPTQDEGDEPNYSDDVARWMHEAADVDADDIDADYLYSTHTIGFALESPLLKNVADDGGGVNITAQNRTELINAFYSLGLLMSDSVSFTAPVVSVDEANRTQSGDRLYMAFFKPGSGEVWQGNLKKYGIDWQIRDDCGRAESEWVVVDKNGDAATDCDGLFKTTSISYWSTMADGGAVASGGVGELLKDAMPGTHVTAAPSVGPYYDFRNIYTYKDGGIVRFWRDADSGTTDVITAEDLGVSAVTDYPVPNLERDKIINYVYGYTYAAEEDVDPTGYNEDAEGDPVAKRIWILGDIIHSEPTIIDYLNADNSLKHRFIAIGANDGMLHIFTDQDINLNGKDYVAGSEVWAFIPSDLLPNLKTLQDPSTHNYFVDGFCSLHRSPDKDPDGYHYKTLVFGERRGGRNYWALDVTDPDPSNWTVKWYLEGGSVDFAELGYSWSRPTFAKIQTGDGSDDFTDVVVFTGGYDPEEDHFPEPWVDGDYDGVYDPSDADDTFDTTDATHDVNDNDLYDTYNPDMNDMGRGIFVVTLESGVSVFTATYGVNEVDTGESQTYPAMKWCFPADPAVIGFTSRLLIYSADVYGQIWKVDYDYYRTANKWTVERIFQANPGSDQAKAADYLTGAPPTTPVLDNTDYGRKAFYSPDVSYQGNDWTDYPVIYLGTGDRAHPRYVPDYHDRFYCVSDTGLMADETDLLNLTCDEFETDADGSVTADVNQDNDGVDDDETDTELQAQLGDLLYGRVDYPRVGETCRGWYRVIGKQGDCMEDSFDHKGEKILSRPTLYFGIVYFTSYQPVFDDPCNPNGNAFIYALDYSDGSAPLDLNLSDDNEAGTLADTYQVIRNSSIPSGVRVITREGKAAGFVSAGGSIAGAGEEEDEDEGHSSTIPGPPGGVSKILWRVK